MWEYTDEVKDHFLNPRNVGIIEDPDGMGEVGSMARGDALKLFLSLMKTKKSRMQNSRLLAVPAQLHLHRL